jgi:hypothetical protein
VLLEELDEELDIIEFSACIMAFSADRYALCADCAVVADVEESEAVEAVDAVDAVDDELDDEPDIRELSACDMIF